MINTLLTNHSSHLLVFQLKFDILISIRNKPGANQGHDNEQNC